MSPVSICPLAAYCQAAVTYLQFPVHVCFLCNDHAQPATHTSVTDTLASPTLVVFNSSIDVDSGGVRRSGDRRRLDVDSTPAGHCGGRL